jgi:hypothetical protein
MKEFLNLLAGSMVTLVLTPAAVHATDFTPGSPNFTVSGNPFNGPVSATIGNSGIAAGTFTDRFLFTLGQTGAGSGGIITTAAGAGNSSDLDFLSATFNNSVTNFTVPLSPNGVIESGGLNDIPIFTGLLDTLTITYLSRGMGSYGGNLSFVPTTTAVPEPAIWAMLICGFAFMGFAFRRQPRQGLRVKLTI